MSIPSFSRFQLLSLRFFWGILKSHAVVYQGQFLKYKRRLSGLLLDRIDLHVDVAPVEEEKLTNNLVCESSDEVRKRVVTAYKKQKLRFKNTKIKSNGEMTPADIKKFCHLTPEALELLKQAISRFSLSARSYFKTIKVSQTIADLSGSELIQVFHIAEALQFRPNDGE